MTEEQYVGYKDAGYLLSGSYADSCTFRAISTCSGAESGSAARRGAAPRALGGVTAGATIGIAGVFADVFAGAFASCWAGFFIDSRCDLSGAGMGRSVANVPLQPRAWATAGP